MPLPLILCVNTSERKCKKGKRCGEEHQHYRRRTNHGKLELTELYKTKKRAFHEAIWSEYLKSEGIEMNELKDTVAVVTGASKGVGAGIAIGMAAEGAAVVVNYASDKAGAERVVAKITGEGGRAIAVQADVSKAADVKRLFDETRKAYGSLDILVNNAGIYRFAELAEVTEEEFHSHFNINVLGVILTTKEALKLFAPKGGSIINIGSVATDITPPQSVVYTASKGAVDSITRVFAKELGPRKIRVNSLNLGNIETEGLHSAGMVGDDFQEGMTAATPLRRGGQPEDVAPIAVFLASDKSGYITGELIRVSGGFR